MPHFFPSRVWFSMMKYQRLQPNFMKMACYKMFKLDKNNILLSVYRSTLLGNILPE